MSFFLRGLAAFAAALFFTPFALSADYALFPRPGQAASDYDEIATRLGPGDRVFFSDAASFVLGDFLGKGKRTLVFAIEGDPGHALRIPLRAQRNPEDIPYEQFLTRFLEGSDAFARLGIRVVKVDHARSLAGERAVVERLALRFTLEEYLDVSSGLILTLSREERSRLADRLVEFAKSTWRLSAIGDFHPGQLGWTGAEWVLFDFTDVARGYRRLRRGHDHVFSEVPLGDFTAARIDREIAKLRATDPSSRCDRLLRRR